MSGAYDLPEGALDTAAFQKMYRVIAAVIRERDEQNTKWGEQNHPDGTGPERRLLDSDYIPRFISLAAHAKRLTDDRAHMGTLTYLDILLEEVFEAAEAEPGSDALRAELVQLAAVAVAWVEKIDRDRAKS